MNSIEALPPHGHTTNCGAGRARRAVVEACLGVGGMTGFTPYTTCKQSSRRRRGRRGEEGEGGGGGGGGGGEERECHVCPEVQGVCAIVHNESKSKSHTYLHRVSRERDSFAQYSSYAFNRRDILLRGIPSRGRTLTTSPPPDDR
jgi:hypothetical protein